MKPRIYNKIASPVLTILALMLFGATAILAQTPTLRANGKIAFTSLRDGNREIYVMNPDGTNQVRLTNNSSADDFPAWSPDGQRLACLSQNAAGGYFIKLMDANGTGQTELTSVLFDGVFDSSTRPAWGMSWSPDGSKIAFTDSHEIFVINVDGSNRVNLTNTPSFDSHPSWSPDGSRIVFSRSTAGSMDGFRFFTMNANGSNQTELPGGFPLPENPYIYDLDPAWSPDGTRLAGVQHWLLDHQELFIRTVAGVGEVSFDCSPSSPAWSPDGTKVVFSAYGAFNFQNGSVEIFAINSDGSGLTQLTNTGSYEAHPSWQPLAPSGCPNPIDCGEVFVRQHYQDFLNREPDGGGLAYWTNRITECGSDPRCIHERRIGISAAFFIEQEFQDSGYYVYRFYKASFGRQPNYAEFTTDRASVIGGPNLEASKQAFADQWVQRAAFTQRYSNTLSNTEFVNKLFDSAGLTASIYNAQRQQEVAAMNAGRSRSLVLRDVIEIPDFKNTPDPNDPRYGEIKQVSQYNPAFVLMQYFGYLKRNVDQGGYDFWLDVVNNREPNNYHGMVCSFVTATEYQLRFGSAVTRSNADCSQ